MRAGEDGVEGSWQFQTIARQLGKAIRYEWCWRTTIDGLTSTSKRTFPTLTECVEDARHCGFRGTVDPAAGFRFTNRADHGVNIQQSDSDGRSARAP